MHTKLSRFKYFNATAGAARSAEVTRISKFIIKSFGHTRDPTLKKTS
jgi:hypothetical protein